MRIFILIIVAIFVISTNCQSNRTSTNFSDNQQLNIEEIKILDSIFKPEKLNVDFKGKKILYVTGSTGNTILTKYTFFNSYILPNIQNNQKLSISFVELNQEEKQSSGGYDIIIAVFVKIFGEKQKQRLLSKFNSNKKL